MAEIYHLNLSVWDFSCRGDIILTLRSLLIGKQIISDEKYGIITIKAEGDFGFEEEIKGFVNEIDKMKSELIKRFKQHIRDFHTGCKLRKKYNTKISFSKEDIEI